MSVRHVALWLALAALSACASHPRVATDASTAFSGPAERHVVVTIRHSQALLPRAGSTVRDYDRIASYDASPAARREVRALASAHGMSEVDGWPIQALGVYCVVFKLPDGLALADAMRQLQRDRRVESVQPLNAFQTLSTSSEPYRRLQKNLDTMRIEQAHALSRGENVRIAVIDTGVDAQHPDLIGRVIVQKNFVDESAAMPPEPHGTAIAGVIAARDDNREGIAGIAPRASVLAMKACWHRDDSSAVAVCNTFTLAKALVAAVDAKSAVINLSLSGPSDPLLQRLVDVGVKRGIIYVGALSDRERGFPCVLAAVICVGSSGRPSDGAQLFAPGHDILTLLPGARYDFVSGSSLAAASVAASVALLRSRDPSLTTEKALRVLAPNATTDGSAPSVDVCAALSRLVGRNGCEDGAPRVPE